MAVPGPTLTPNVRGNDRTDGWDRLLADVTGRPAHTTPLIAALSAPLTTEEREHLAGVLAPLAPARPHRAFGRCWRSTTAA